MKKLRKLGILTLSTGLTIGILAPAASATSLGNEHYSPAQIQVAQTEKVISKSELIKKFKAFFPQFDYLKDSEFHSGSGYQYPEDTTIRYDLHFQKKINGKQMYGSVSFLGDDLKIERFHYEPTNAVDALFPAKITKEKATEVAKAFLKNFPESKDYHLETNHINYYPLNQLLTEPIRYSFSFVKKQNNVPIPDQQIQVTVLGNGEVTEFYQYSGNSASPSYDDATKILPKDEIIKQMKERISVDLQYRVETNYRTGDTDVNLIYQPINNVIGVHALSGEWQLMNGFTPELQNEHKIEHIVTQPLKPKQTNISLADAKAFAETLLKIDSDKIKLRFDSIEERKNFNGQEVINIQYMYEYESGGSGTNLELDKHTGEIIQYHDIKEELLKERDNSKQTDKAISNEEALNKAVHYLKLYAPSYLHEYAMPIGEFYHDEDRGIYHFVFPRVANGIIVNGEQLTASISANGALLGLNVYQSDIQNWPSIDKVIPKEKAQEKYFEELNLNLNYVKEGYGKKDNHYHLVYSQVFQNNTSMYLDAVTGEWNRTNENDDPVVSHPWAEKELNHLIQAKILNVEEQKSFDANAKMTKGAALEVITKSITHFYDHYYPEQNETSHSFENIKPTHPLYQVIERAVTLGIIEKEETSFNLDEHLTREELAIWYIRLLGLEQAAKNQGIYHLPFSDAKDVKAENVGYVALAHSIGLLTANKNKFNPKQDVSYADLAVSVIRLAHETYEKGIQFYNY
ncbi:hypothetical protein J2Z40_002726 [Cytobacillus eiseniae]|uniref:SLH domain-containing protein n=1 Tax=Cytobacillus eiseniae TaxID=762947 RepID=A0ABS4RHD0_9BACI|nr:YcdB/YcdC domain-containing protein [Cytobacillus eiseniae]MBP2242153.1 hypothetical protein [Cytobacillus eiseniae]